jgi:hypothetical protein
MINNIQKFTPLISIDDFPSHLVEMIRECAPKNSINDFNRIIRKTREDIDENNILIERLGNKIDVLVSGLNQEVVLRKELEADLKKDLTESSKEVNDIIKYLKGAIWLATALGGIAVTIFVTWLCGWLKIQY